MMHEMLLFLKKNYIGKAKLDIEEKYIGIIVSQKWKIVSKCIFVTGKK